MDNTRVLIVEDNPFNQKVTAMMLNDAGCEVDIADNGQTAFTLCQHHHYLFILLDIGLPDMSGLDLASKIRTYEIHHHRTPMPIIALTMHALEEDKMDAYAAGIDDYLVKPLLQSQLRQIIHQAHRPTHE